MEDHAVILIAEDDRGHFELVKRNLWLSCIDYEIMYFRDGQQILDFLFKQGSDNIRKDGKRYVLLLDIRMPKIDGREVLRKIRMDDQLKQMPVIMLTTTDNQEEINRCYEMGCSFYMVKPVNYSKFLEAVENLGQFLSVENLKIPAISD